MGKEMVPRFKCPLCGWLAYYSMFEKGPHKLEIKGMKYDGFQGISYHRVWGSKKQYKEFLCVKVRELAEELGLKILGDEEVDDYEEELDDYEEEVEAEPDVDEEEDDDEIDLEALGLGSPPSERVMEIPTERIAPIEYTQSTQVATEAKSYKEFTTAYAKEVEKDHVVTANVEDTYIRTEDTEFVDLGGDK